MSVVQVQVNYQTKKLYMVVVATTSHKDQQKYKQ